LGGDVWWTERVIDVVRAPVAVARRPALRPKRALRANIPVASTKRHHILTSCCQHDFMK
jgi:hypothetical protein